MKVSARSINKGKGISISRLAKERKTHTSGTVVMKNVRFGRSVLGELVEEAEKQLKPRSNAFMNVSSWPTARYVARLGYYIDTDTHEKVSSASAVYMVGSTIYYM